MVIIVVIVDMVGQLKNSFSASRFFFIHRLSSLSLPDGSQALP